MDEKKHESASRYRLRRISTSWSENRRRERALRPYEASPRSSHSLTSSSSSPFLSSSTSSQRLSSSPLLSSSTSSQRLSSSAASRDVGIFGPNEIPSETQVHHQTSLDPKKMSSLESPDSYKPLKPWGFEIFEALQSQSLPSAIQPVKMSNPSITKSQDTQYNFFKDQQNSGESLLTASSPRPEQLDGRLYDWFNHTPRSPATTTIREQPLPDVVMTFNAPTNSQAPCTATSQAQRSKSWQSNVSSLSRYRLMNKMISNFQRKTQHSRSRCRRIVNNIDKEVFNSARSEEDYTTTVVSRCSALADEQKAITPNATSSRDRTHSFMNYPGIDVPSANQNSDSPRDDAGVESSTPTSTSITGLSGASSDVSQPLSYFKNILKKYNQPVPQLPSRPSAATTSSTSVWNSVSTNTEPHLEPCLTSPWHRIIRATSNSQSTACSTADRAALTLQRINRLRMELLRNWRYNTNYNNTMRSTLVASRRERFVDRITNLRANFYSDYQEPYALSPESRSNSKSIEYRKILAVASILKMNWSIYGMKRLPGHLRCNDCNCKDAKPCIHRRLANSVLKHEAAASA